MEKQVGTKQESNVAEEIKVDKYSNERREYTMEDFKEYLAEREARIKCNTVSRTNQRILGQVVTCKCTI